MNTKVSLVIIAFGEPQLVSDLLASLATHPDAVLIEHIVVVENGVPPGHPSRLLPFPPSLTIPLTIVRNPSRSYASGVNQGVAATASPIVLVSNNDVLWAPNESIAPLIATLTDSPAAAIAGPQLQYPNGGWQRSFGKFPSICAELTAMTMWAILVDRIAAQWLTPSRRTVRQVDYVDGAFFAVRRTMFDSISGLDESYPFYGEDVEFSWQARRRGFDCLHVPAARIRHVRGATSMPTGSTAFLTRLHQAKIRFVASHFGRRRAIVYRWLMGIHTRQIALLSMLAMVFDSSPRAVRRQALARLAVRALNDIPTDVLDKSLWRVND